MPLGDGQLLSRARSFITEPLFANVEGMTPEDVARRRALAEALWSQGMSEEPVTSITGGIAKMLQAYLGGKAMWRSENSDAFLRNREQERSTASTNSLIDMLFPQTAPQVPPPAVGQPGFDGRPSRENVAAFENAAAPMAFAPIASTDSPSLINYNYGADTVRNQPISADLETVLNAAARDVGIDQIIVGSGGQSTAEAGGNRTGSTRHDDGGAADIQLIVGGRTLDFTNPQDQRLVQQFVTAAHGYGATGIGAGTDYMGNNTIHVGFGAPAVWGAGGASAAAPDWLVAAYNAPGGQQGGAAAGQDQRTILRQLASDPSTLPIAQAIIQQQVAAMFAPPERQDLIATDNPIYDPNTGQWIAPPASATPAEAPETLVLEGPDGKPHRFGWNPNTGQFDQDMGVAAGQPNYFENTWDRLTAEQQVQISNDILGGEQTALNQLQNFDAMEALASDPAFYSGAGAGIVANARRLGAMLGISDPNSVASIEAFSGLAAQAALDAMGGSLGAGFSNADRDFIERTMPNLGFTEEGNRTLIAIHRAIANRKIQIAAMLRQAGGRPTPEFMQTLTRFALDNPLFQNGIPGAPSSPVAAPQAPTQPGFNAPPAPLGAPLFERDGIRIWGTP